MPILANLKKLKNYGLLGLLMLNLAVTLNLPAQDSTWSNTMAGCIANIPEATEVQSDQSTMLLDVQACQNCCQTGAKAQNVSAMALFGCLESCCILIDDQDSADVTNRESCCQSLFKDNKGNPTALLTALAQAGYKISGPDSVVPTLLQGCIGT